MMRRVLTTVMIAGALAAGSMTVLAQGDGGFKLVPNWPKLPAGLMWSVVTESPMSANAFAALMSPTLGTAPSKNGGRAM